MAINFRSLIPYGIMTTCILSRVLPHPGNFTATNATMVYGNSVCKPWFNILFPIIVFFISDCINHLFRSYLPIFGMFCLYTYPTYILISLITKFVTNNEKQVSYLKTISLLLSSSVIFFLTTNFGVWCLGYDNRSLIQVYIDGLPFFGREILATLAFGFLYFAIHLQFVQKPQNQEEEKNYNSIQDSNESQVGDINSTERMKDPLTSESNKV